MIKLILNFVLILYVLNLNAQTNLVPNPSFEDSLGCPSNIGQISYSRYWFSPNLATPDYFHSCSTICGVPFNSDGFQEAKTGIAYVGAIMTGGWREYVSSHLITPLIKGKNYCVEFYVNLASISFPQPSDSVILGVFFSNDSIFNSSTGIIPYTPQITNSLDQNLNDTSNWVKISGIYTSNGGEQFITIGNFYSDEFFYGLNYYYIEDVSVVCCDCINTSCGELFVPNVFSPNGDNQNDVLKVYGNCISTIDFIIFDRWGEKVFETVDQNIAWDGTYNGQQLDDAVFVYYLKATVNGKEVVKQGNVAIIK